MAEDGADDAELVLRDRENFGETHAEVKGYTVPALERYPDGVKYSMNYWRDEPDEETDDEGTIVRYDNFPDHPGAPLHHKHVGADIEPVDFPGLWLLYQRFKREVIENGEHWD